MRHNLIELRDILVGDVHRRLQLLDVDLLDVLDARGPLAGLEAQDTADDLDEALHEDERPGNGDDRLEVVERGTVGGDARMLEDPPGVAGIVVAGPAEGGHPGEEEEDVERQVEGGLHTRREETVEDVAADHAVLREGVGARHHEQDPVHLEHDIEGPGVRCIDGVAGVHLVGDQKGEPHDEPGKRLAGKRADLVNGEQYFLHIRSFLENSHPDADSARMAGRSWCKTSQSFFAGAFLAAEIMVIGHSPVDVGIHVPGHRALGERDLRFDDLLEQWVIRRLLRHDLVINFELPFQDRVRGLVELDLVLGLQLNVVLRVAVNRLPGHVGRGGLYTVFDDRLQLGGQGVELGLVEQNLELLGVLVETLQHAHLGDVGEAEQPVGGGVVELRPVQEAAVHGRDDLASGQRIYRRAQGGVDVNGEPHGTELHTLHVLQLCDRLFEPAERLRKHRPVGERDDVGADGRIELRQQLLAAAVLVPGEEHVGVHAIAGTRPPQRQRVLLAVVVDDDAVGAVERSLGDRVQHAEGRHHGTRRKHFDLQIAAGHVIDLLGEVKGVLVENVLGRPGGLPAHRNRPLRLGDHREAQRRGPGGHCGSACEELAS